MDQKEVVREVRNINTLTTEIEKEFMDYVSGAKKLELDCLGDYIDGFRAGVKALQLRFLKAMDQNKLDYVRK